ncbi:MAG: hypothetical protein R2754_18405 [Microthrixaceae bacterium]
MATHLIAPASGWRAIENLVPTTGYDAGTLTAASRAGGGRGWNGS